MEQLIINIISSKPDKFGNQYHMVTAFNPVNCKVVEATAGTHNNIATAEFHIRGRWPQTGEPRWVINRSEIPIRQFNRESKGLPYAGCDPKEILAFLRKELE